MDVLSYFVQDTWDCRPVVDVLSYFVQDNWDCRPVVDVLSYFLQDNWDCRPVGLGSSIICSAQLRLKTNRGWTSMLPTG